MKILQVLPELKLAGAQIMVENLARELKNMGNDLCIISLFSYHTPISERLEKDNIQIYYLDKKSGFDSSMISKIRKIVRVFNPDVIHTHSYVLKYVYVATRNNHHAVRIHTIHNIAEKETTRANLMLEKFLIKKRITTPVAISPQIEESIKGFYGIAAGQVPMIYNGISLNKCIPKYDYRFHDGVIRIIHIGRFEEQKNHEMIVEAIKILSNHYPNAQLFCFGEGSLEEKIRQQIEENKLDYNIKLVGLTDNPYAEITKSDLFILPSRWEGMPITLIEAMGSGMPIIATDVGGVTDMVSNGKSALICENNPKSLSDAIESLIQDMDLRYELGNTAKKRAQFFSAEQMAKKYEELYLRLESCR